MTTLGRSSEASSQIQAAIQPATSPELSIVVPFFNEAENVRALYREIGAALEQMEISYELLFVNDGSLDDTLEIIQEIAAQDDTVKLIDLSRNYGQTAAMMAGFDYATGAIVVAMDGDGQNDPAEISNLVNELNKGYDVVSGWRRDRQDRALSRKIPSSVANWLISKVSGVHLHDFGCSLKAYRRDVIAGVRLYGEMHRFIPIYTAWQGGRIAEIPVNHRARMYGESKYGLNRIFKVLLDLLLLVFMERYMTKPIYLFGGIGAVFLFLALIAAIWSIGLKLLAGISFVNTPLPILLGTFFTAGLVCILMGLLAELIMRTYYEAQGKRIYRVRGNDGDG